MSSPARSHLQVLHHFTVAEERVFDAWTDPVLMARWMALARPAEAIARITIDLRIGGALLITRNEGNPLQQLGEFLVIDRPRRLQLSWMGPRQARDSALVTITIQPTGTGCDLTLEQEHPAPTEEAPAPNASAWNTMLRAIATSLG